MQYNQYRTGGNVKITIVDRLFSVIAPHHCYGCGDSGPILCDCCKNDILEETFSRCVKCASPTRFDNICPAHALPYQHLWCTTERSGAVAAVIDAYKFQRARSAARVLAEMIDHSLPLFEETIVLVPIPTAPQNIRIRGYDHMLLIARLIARQRGWQVASPLKRRSNITQHFAKNAAQRHRQAVNFFEVTGKISPQVTYLVIDDIFTTGSTVAAAVNCLKKAGAERVWVGVLARHVNPRATSRGGTGRLE